MRKDLLIALSVPLAFALSAGAVQARIIKQWDSDQQRFIVYDSETHRIISDPDAVNPPVPDAVNPPVRSSRVRAGSPIKRQIVDYDGPYRANTIIISTEERRLYFVFEPGKALKYGVGVGREGFQWAGTANLSRKAEWPGWTPPAPMIAREKAKGRILPAYMPGGLDNPLGARALYIGATLYRIHGSNEPWTIGQAVSSGCIRMTNEDVIDLYDRVKVGAKIVVLR